MSPKTPVQPERQSPAPEQAVAPEPSTESQADIADTVQKGIAQANTRDRDASPPDRRAGHTGNYDGNPTPKPDNRDSGVLKPHDDTPAVLRKRPGPRP